jgi:hypothetical protein
MIALDPEQPTLVTFSALYTWVIWQFPWSEGEPFCGAVHPPQSERAWYPALIFPGRAEVLISGHLGQTFATPEEAAQQLQTPSKSL